MKSQQAVSEAVLTSELLGIRLRPTQTKCLTGVKVGTLSNPLFIISPQNSSTGIQTGKKMHSKKKKYVRFPKIHSAVRTSQRKTHTPHTAIGARLETNLIWYLCVSPPHPPHHHRWSWGVCAFFGVWACVCDCKVSASNCDRLLEQIWRRVSKNKKGRKKGEGAFRSPARPAERCHSAHCKKTDNSVRTVSLRRGFSCLNTRGSVLKWFDSAVHWF